MEEGAAGRERGKERKGRKMEETGCRWAFQKTVSDTRIRPFRADLRVEKVAGGRSPVVPAWTSRLISPDGFDLQASDGGGLPPVPLMRPLRAAEPQPLSQVSLRTNHLLLGGRGRPSGLQ